MGMFDTIIFDRPIPCPKCGAEIRSDQTKAFECTLDDYRIGDCIAHAEEIRIVGDELYCEACKAFTTRYYLAVYRGVLVGIEQEREAAEALLRSFNFEKLLLWYHDLYRKRERARGATHRAEMFMHNVCEWFEGGYDKHGAGRSAVAAVHLESGHPRKERHPSGGAPSLPGRTRGRGQGRRR